MKTNAVIRCESWYGAQQLTENTPRISNWIECVRRRHQLISSAVEREPNARSARMNVVNSIWFFLFWQRSLNNRAMAQSDLSNTPFVPFSSVVCMYVRVCWMLPTVGSALAPAHRIPRRGWSTRVFVLFFFLLLLLLLLDDDPSFFSFRSLNDWIGRSFIRSKGLQNMDSLVFRSSTDLKGLHRTTRRRWMDGRWMDGRLSLTILPNVTTGLFSLTNSKRRLLKFGYWRIIHPFIDNL
jgi:hypothetical protein